MKILKGTVLDVKDKGEGEKRWAIVGIQCETVDRDGFVVQSVVKLRVFGEQYQGGLHNAYRALKGKQVYAPYNDQFDGQYNRISYSLVGLPLALQEVPQRQAAAASASA